MCCNCRDNPFGWCINAEMWSLLSDFIAGALVTLAGSLLASGAINIHEFGIFIIVVGLIFITSRLLQILEIMWMTSDKGISMRLHVTKNNSRPNIELEEEEDF